MQYPGHILTHLGGHMDLSAAVLDQMFHVIDEHGLPNEAGAAGMPARAHEIRVAPAFMVAPAADDPPSRATRNTRRPA